MLITPSGVPYADMESQHIAAMSLDHDRFDWDGPCKPSSVWHFHRSILAARPDVGAIVHTHSMYATIVSIARENIPACHYMVAAFGGNNVVCAEYATFGTPALSAAALAAMQERNACLLANHGMIATGTDLDKAMWSAVELETLAKMYWHAKLADAMVVVPDDEMQRVIEKFRHYGQRKATTHVTT